MMLKLVFGLVLGGSALAAAVAATGGSVPLPVLFSVSLPVLGILAGSQLAAAGPAAMGGLFKAYEGLSRQRALAAEASLRLANRTLVSAGIAGFLIQFTWMMKSLENREALWPNLAWSFGPGIAALFFHSFLILPLEHWVKEGKARGRADAGGAAGGMAASLRPEPWSRLWFALGSLITLGSLVAFAPGALLSMLFIDAAALVVALFAPLALLVAALSPGSLRRGIRALRDGDARQADLLAAGRGFSLLAASLRRAAALGASLGFALLVKDWLDRSRSGPSLALALICSFWCMLMLLAAALPLEAAAERRAALAADGA